MSANTTEAQTINTYTKDPGAKLDYSLDWRSRGWLQTGVNIATSTWEVPAGLTKVSETNDSDGATVILSGGTPGVDYRVTNKITLDDANSLADERSILIKVRER